MQRPRIGITVDNKDNTAESRRYESGIAYSRAIAEAGGLPLLLPHEPALADDYVALCDGIMLTGGADPRMEAFGQRTHEKARPVDERRQAFELAMLAALDRRRERPALGICLGMQFMGLHAGGRLNQHLPDTLGEAAALHQKDARHAVKVRVRDSVLVGSALRTSSLLSPRGGEEVRTADPTKAQSLVTSWHRQALDDPGRLRLIATAPDGVIEAIDDPSRPFYLGVQWHPERGDDGPLSRGLLARFVDACRHARG